jgi:DNA polymerase-1
VSPLLLIDGDQFIFRATAAVEKETRWDDQNHVLYSNENEAWDTLTGMLERIFERFDSREHVLTFSAPPNFRFGVDPTYKSNRADTRKPLCYATLREMVEDKYKCLAMAGLEADDVMGILATKPGKTKRIIVSADKDMKSIPTTIWDGKDVVHVTPEEADRFHLYQTLIGDTSDGYKGCPGIGAVSATKFLDEPFTLESYQHELKSGPRKGQSETRWREVPLAGQAAWRGVVSHYEKAGLTEADALTQARLARILRWSDWDSNKKAPILWQP